MNAADLARLEIAKRAYAAAQPSATEVQTGVRRARLSLRRVKARRTWFGKGLVLVVLAVGSLAYAKPHALGDLVENLTRAGRAGTAKRGVGVSAPVHSPLATSLTKDAANAVAATKDAATKDAATKDAATAAAATARPDASPAAIEPALGESRKPAPRAVSVPTRVHGSRSASEIAASAAKVGAARTEVSAVASKTPPSPAAVSDWGRVAQALANGDETKALAALNELSDSGDQRTRDKADLGRAQLFMAHGNRDEGCALGRSLSNRRAGGRIERQAQLLLKSCTR